MQEYEYDIKTPIGAGGFANVYLGKKKSDGLKVAIKMVFMSYYAMTEADKNSVNREIEAMKQLQHPMIVKFIECFIENGFIYIITEFAEGGSLENKLKEKKKFGHEESFRYFLMLCIGLYSIHKQNLVHRDISAKNLFLKTFKNTNLDLLIIGDFGLVR